VDRAELGEVARLDELLAAHEAALGGHAEEVVEVRVGAEELAVAARVGAVHVDQRDVERQRRHRDEFLAVGVRGTHRAQRRVDRHHVGAEARARRQERQPQRGGVEPPLQHALVQFGRFERPGLPRVAEVRLERDRVERDEAVDEFADLAGGAEQADVGTAVRNDGEILHRRAQDFPHQRHRLAPRTPAADAERHPVAQLGDGGGSGHALVHGGER
jgi:hypothetical protein